MNRLLRRTCSAAVALAAVLTGALATVVLTSPPAGAISPFGVQRLIVVLIEHPHNGCPIPVGTPSNVPQCPRYTASQWQTIFQRDVDAWFRAESYGQTSFQVHVLVNPDTADGWWPAPRSQTDYQSHDAFSQVGSIGRDAGEVVMGQALDKGVVTTAELDQTHRLIMMDNFHARGGTTYAIGGTITYHPNGHAFTTSNSLIPEAANDTEALSLAEHELTHQLGAPDLYGSPCPFTPPGAPRDHRTGNDNDCVGPWDHMALDFWGYPGFSSYTRQRLRWLNPSSSTPQVKQVTKAFSGTVTLDPVERPAGGALVLRVPDNPAHAFLDKIFGNPGPYQGFMVECRRKIVHDQGIPAEGALVTYYEPSRSSYAPIAVARQGFGGVSTAALSTPGQGYQNTQLGVTFTYVGATASGGCIVDVNKTRRFYPAYVPVASMSAVMDSSPAFGGDQPFSGFAGTGVVVGGGGAAPILARADSARRKTTLTPITRGHRATIRFGYANAGAKTARGGTAVVRVNDPYAVTVCGHPSRGRVVATVPLKKLKPGRSATHQVSFVPRSNGPIGVTVTIKRSGKKVGQEGGVETGTLAFTSATSSKKKVHAANTKVLLRSSKKGCDGPVTVNLVPLVQPDGWTLEVKGTSTPLAPGTSRKVSVVATPPLGAKPDALQVPVAIQAGAAHHPGGLQLPYGRSVGDLDLLGGLDLMLRVGRPGGRPPAFVLAGPATLPAAVSYPTAPPGPTASSLAITCPSSADFAVIVPGVLAPATAGALVTMTYRQNVDGQVITHQLSTDVNGRITDSFVAPRAGWTVQASWAGDAAHTGAVSNSCEFAIPIG